MAAFQAQVYTSVAPGVAGDPATPDQAIYTPQNFLAGSGGVDAGAFAFAYSSAADTIAIATGAGKPLGIVQRNLSYPNYTLTSEGTLHIAEGEALTIAVKGDFWMQAPAAATVGQKVYVDNTSGTISLNSAGATVSGSTETDWTVKTPATSGGMMIVSNWP